MRKRFKQHIEQNFPFLNHGKFLVAVSGGIDSVVLAHLCHQLRFNFSLCHCNFKLRNKESDADKAFVDRLGEELQVPVYNTSFETVEHAKKNKISIQVAARELRYAWFYKLIEKKQYDYVLTAHNTDDNLETFIINLTRGAGLEGLAGIPSINKKTVRPLLAFSRDEILLFAVDNKIVWREDSSNSDPKYTRNKIRHGIIPVLREINPYVLNSFQNTVAHLNESRLMIDDFTAIISKKILTYDNDLVKIDCDQLAMLQNKKAYLYQILHPYGFKTWRDIVGLISSRSGKRVFSKTHYLLKDRNYLILTKINKKRAKKECFLIKESTSAIVVPFRLSLQETSDKLPENNHQIIVNKNLIQYPLSLRKWRHGDLMYPMGMKGSKKVSQLFKDKKLSLIEKEKIWILVDAKDNVIWVLGLRQDRRFKADLGTKTRLKISYCS